MRDKGTYGKSAKGKADRLFSLIVRSRGRCEACGESDYAKLQCAHIVRRVYSATRCDEANAIAACWSCHRRFTDNPVEWVDFLNAHIGREKFDMLKAKAEAGVKAGNQFWVDEVSRLEARCVELGVETRKRSA